MALGKSKTLDGFLRHNTSKTVLVVGDYIVDRYIYGEAKKISPEAPVPVILKTREEQRHGGAGNVVHNLIKLGAEVRYAAIVGEGTTPYDSLCELLFDELDSDHYSLIYSSSTMTPIKTRVICEHQQIVRMDEEDECSYASERDTKKLLARIKEFSENISAIVISDYCKGTITKGLAQDIIKLGKRNDIPVIVDTKRELDDDALGYYKGAYTITPNLKEFENLTSHLNPYGCTIADGTMERVLELFVEEFGLKMGVVTMSDGGIALYKDGEYLHLDVDKKMEVYDVTGAGDSSLAAIAISVCNGFGLSDTAKFANACGGIAVGHLGTYAVSTEDVKAYFHSDSRIVNKNVIASSINKLKEAGKTIVFTNGCFDLLHAGHLDLLKEAKRQGDILVVGLNSDKSVKKLKGNDRPIIGQDERAKMLISLKDVDYVTIYDDSTPYNLIKQIEPNVLVKGEEWKDNVVGSEFADEVYLIKHKNGTSTSDIINKIKRRKK